MYVTIASQKGSNDFLIAFTSSGNQAQLFLGLVDPTSLVGVSSSYFESPYAIVNKNNFQGIPFLYSAICNEETSTQIGNFQGIYWDIPSRHVVDTLQGPPFQCRYENGIILDALFLASQVFNISEFSQYVDNYRSFFLENIQKIGDERSTFGEREGPFLGYFRYRILDDYGTETIPFINRILTEGNNTDDWRFISKSIQVLNSIQVRLPDQTFARLTPQKFTVWADDLWMGGHLSIALSKVVGSQFLDEVAEQVVSFDSYLRDDDGLYFHGYFDWLQKTSCCKWGRANGWTMMAITRTLEMLNDSHPLYEKILEIYKIRAEGLMKVQSEEGRWHQVLNNSSTYLETSCTSMFIASLAIGVKNEWIDSKTYFPIIERGWSALCNQTTEQGDVIGICIGTGIMYSDEEYNERPTAVSASVGMGAFLYAATAYYQLINK